MKYLARLKSEKQPPDVLQKLQEPPFDSFCSTEGRPFSEIAPAKPVVEQAPPVTELPTWCQGAACPRFELIPEVGPGCLRRLDSGAWRTEWLALRVMLGCPRRLH